MDVNEYQKLALKTLNPKLSKKDILISATNSKYSTIWVKASSSSIKQSKINSLFVIFYLPKSMDGNVVHE